MTVLNLSNVHESASGIYGLHAINPAGTNSSAAKLTVLPPFFSLGLLDFSNTVWRYDQSGADLGTSWRGVAYDDTGWLAGRALLGFDPNPAQYPEPIRTPLEPGPITYYFRTDFVLPSAPTGVTLLSSNLLDDGAVIYINGYEAVRIRMPTNVIGYQTLAGTAPEPGMVDQVILPSGLLIPGMNLLAAEVHQSRTNGDSVVFGMALTALVPDTNSPELFARPGSSNSVVVGWFGPPGAFMLQESSDLVGPWRPMNVTPSVSGSLNEVIISPALGKRFFRLAPPVTTAPRFVVTNTNDSGAGSLRQAILNINTNIGTGLISFNIPGPGVQTITPLTALPPITNAMTIDGYTQPGASCNTLTNDNNAILLIEIDGEFITGTPNGYYPYGLLIEASGTTVRGLVINRVRDLADLGAGQAIQFSYPDTPQNVTIQGCFLGTDPTGTIPRPNGNGIVLQGSHCLIGGPNPCDRNLISGNAGSALFLNQSIQNQILGNLIGTDIHGTNALGNGIGISVIGSGQDCLTNTIGGTSPGAGNVISGNYSDGIYFYGSTGARNAYSNIIAGNLIGTDISGTKPLGNLRHGINIEDGAWDNTMCYNTIAYNASNGIRIFTNFFATGGLPLSTNNAVRTNSIFANGLLGISFGPDSGQPTPNHLGGPVPGPNFLQNHPIIASVLSGPSLAIQTSLNGAPNTSYHVEFFGNSSSTPGQGQTFLGATNILTGAAGQDGSATTSFTYTTPFGGSLSNLWITSTATDPSGNTSEFSPAVQVPPGP
jgi:hypothetical protein